MTERALRVAAVVFAGLGLLDPALTMTGRTRSRLSLVVQRGGSMELPATLGAESRTALAERLRTDLAEALSDRFEVVGELDSTAPAAVVFGDRYPDEPIPPGVSVSTVSVGAPLSPNVAVAELWAPRAVPPATAVRIGARVEASGVRGATSELVVRAGGAEVGRASHAWSADRETWRPEVDVVPIGRSPFTFDVAIEALSSELTAADNRAKVSAGEARRLRVLVFEARPSWTTAFVRRALERDPRFEVGGVARASPQALVRSGPAQAIPREPSPGDWDAFDAVVVGGIDALPAGTLAVLDRFMRERGGGVAVLPDVPIAPAAGALTAGVALREVLLQRAAVLETPGLPRLDASELLEAADLPVGADVLARAPSSRRAVVWSVARGDGRLLVSGAMDSWRYRADADVAYERFWRSVVAGLALAARPAVEVTLEPPRARAGDVVRATARVRSLERNRLGTRLAVSGRAAGLPFRLWPDARRGVFVGYFVADAKEHAQVEVSLNDGLASGTSTLTMDGHPHEPSGLPLALLAETRGGIDVAPADVTALARHLRENSPALSAEIVRHPTRSPLWFLGFAVSLSAEWWLRRRRGAR